MKKSNKFSIQKNRNYEDSKYFNKILPKKRISINVLSKDFPRHKFDI